MLWNGCCVIEFFEIYITYDICHIAIVLDTLSFNTVEIIIVKGETKWTKILMDINIIIIVEN